MDGGVFPHGEYPLPGSSKGGNIYLSQAAEHYRREKKQVARTCPGCLSKRRQVAGIPNRMGSRLPPLSTAKMNWEEGFLHDVTKKVQVLNSGHICLFNFCSMCFVFLRRRKKPISFFQKSSWERMLSTSQGRSNRSH